MISIIRKSNEETSVSCSCSIASGTSASGEVRVAVPPGVEHGAAEGLLTPGAKGLMLSISTLLCEELGLDSSFDEKSPYLQKQEKSAKCKLS